MKPANRRTLSTASILLAAFLASPFGSSRAVADSIDIRLALDGRDVTGAFDVEIGFFDVALPKDAPPAFRCRAGERIVVPKGTFRLDVKSDDVVPWSRPVVTSDGRPSAVVHEFRIQVIRAALLRTPAGSYPAGSRLDVLSVPHGILYQRRIAAEAKIVPVPAEDSIYGLVGPGGRLIGILRMTPAAGEIFDLPPLPRLARGIGQLYVGLRYPPGFDEPGKQLAPAFVTEGEVSPADVLVDCGSYLAAFWFRAPAGTGRLSLETGKWTTASSVSLQVPDRGAESRGSVPIAARPPLDVDFEVPDGLRAAPAALELLDCRAIEDATGPPELSRCKSIASRQGRADQRFHFDGLGLGTHALRWRVDALSDAVRIDVTEAKPVRRVVKVRAFSLAGTVRRAGRPVADATLSFSSPTLSSRIVASTNEEGRYEVELAREGLYEVRVESAAGVHETTVAAKGGVEADIDIPPMDLQVRVTESSTGDPIAGAKVVASLALAAGMSNWFVVTSVDGSGKFPPLPAGSFRLLASADGYESAEAIGSTLESQDKTRTVELRLSPVKGRRLMLIEQTGEPASGAVIPVPGASDLRAGTDGMATIPERIPPGTGLFAWNRAGRLVFFRLSDGRDQQVRFGAAGPPIRMKAVRPTGDPVTDWAPVVFVDGVPFSGPSEQARLAGSDLWPRRDGGLRLAGFPSSGVIVMAPIGSPELVVTRNLPLDEEIVFTLPVQSGP